IRRLKAPQSTSTKSPKELEPRSRSILAQAKRTRRRWSRSLLMERRVARQSYRNKLCILQNKFAQLNGDLPNWETFQQVHRDSISQRFNQSVRSIAREFFRRLAHGRIIHTAADLV